MATLRHSIHLDLDGAFSQNGKPVETYLDCREWGPRLRYSALQREIEEYYEFVAGHAARFTLFGSGDFHHLSALWLRRIEKPFVLLSFDNHPDWDIRPPKWCCGTWINRALALPMLTRAAIWGCGNFELNWPGYLFVSRKALRNRRLEVWPWRERMRPSGVRRWGGMTGQTWRNEFSEFARRHGGRDVYVTVDLDCLREAESVTNWEHGLFSAEDVAWAVREIQAHATIIGGDVCGAYSEPRYARWFQEFTATRDHPPGPVIHRAEAAQRNDRAFGIVWEALTGEPCCQVERSGGDA